MAKEIKEMVEINPNTPVAWFYTDWFNQRGDPITTKLKDVEFGTSPRFPMLGDIVRERNWKIIFFTLKNKGKNPYNTNKYYSLRARVIRKDKKFYIERELLEQDEELKKFVVEK